MGIKTFAAIDVGSFELMIKIFELSPRYGMREIDQIRHRIDLGTDTYATGKISNQRVEELCRVLKEFQKVMDAYQVADYRACGTSAVREMENTGIILDQIKVRTGIKIEVLSNSEQRFLDYKSIASKGEGFNKIIERGTAIVDIGGGSIQISLFDRDRLVSTQNMRLGVLRIRERLAKLQPTNAQYEELIDEMVNNKLAVFKRLYLKDRDIKNIIVVDDYVSVVLRHPINTVSQAGYVDSETYLSFVEKIRSKTPAEISKSLGIPEENASLLFLSAILIKRFLILTGAELLWAPGVSLCDGIAYDYADKNSIISTEHDFEQDIIACAQNISKRYMGSKRRGETLEQLTLTIFDNMKKVHGLGKRERLLLRLAALLHDCGKYISLTAVAECSYSIIMATEMIGLSHLERNILANIVKYNHMEFDYAKVRRGSGLEADSYLMVAKLTAILRVANGLDRSHKQKFKNIRVSLKEQKLIITVDTGEDITLEKGLFDTKADFFEEVYSVRPVIKQKRT